MDGLRDQGAALDHPPELTGEKQIDHALNRFHIEIDAEVTLTNRKTNKKGVNFMKK